MKTPKKKKGITYVIRGEPMPLQRARFSSRSRVVYDSQKQMKLVCGLHLKSQHNDLPLYSGPLHMDITFFMYIPPHSERKYMHHIYKPDLDNLIKWINDIANGILYKDDCSISIITAKKVYDYEPRTEFTLEVIE